MPHVIDHKIYHHDQKLGWVDGSHVRGDAGMKLGWVENGFIFNEHDGRKIAYIRENQLVYENGRAPSALEHINEEIQGNIPIPDHGASNVRLDLEPTQKRGARRETGEGRREKGEVGIPMQPW